MWGPIAIGTIAGSMGAFLPFDKGLAPIASAVPWAIQGAFFSTVFYFLNVHDPTYKEWMSGMGVLPTTAMAHTTVQLFLTTTLCLQEAYLGPNFNPFGPVHYVLYRVFLIPPPTGVKRKKN